MFFLEKIRKKENFMHQSQVRAAEVQGNYQNIHHLVETKIGSSSEPNAVHTLSKTTTLNI